MNMLGKISIIKFSPQTAKRGAEMTVRKKNLRDEFETQNKNELPNLIKNCRDKESLMIKVIFNLNKNDENPATLKKDLDNLLKVLLDIFPEEMDDDKKERGLGIIIGNKDERVREINCHKEFVETHDEQGISVEFFEFTEN